MKQSFEKLAKQYKLSLLEDVIPFWENYSPDQEYGGYFTCLNQTGQVYDTDKFIWLQGRQVWTFSMLFNRVEPREEWLEMARMGAHFLKTKGTDAQGDFYFSLNRSGKPLIQPYNIFSDCFAALAFYQYGLASEDDSYMDLAGQTFQRILARQKNPKGKYEKSTGKRPMKGFALPMILANLMLEIEGLIAEKEVAEVVDRCIDEVMNDFYCQETGLLHEFVSVEGYFLDTFEGRLINPGHGIEAMWFMMDIAAKKGDQLLMEKAINRALAQLSFGWDKEHGGIFYFLDAKGAPPLQLEWDQKLWWVHLEALVALAKAYQYTHRTDVWEWYNKVNTYTWKHFPDVENGEWFGYLNRQGEVLLPLKGGKWKGCYHLPRALYECWQTFEMLTDKESTLFN